MNTDFKTAYATAPYCHGGSIAYMPISPSAHLCFICGFSQLCSGERELRAVKNVTVRRSIVAKHKSAMHREAEPGLQVSPQAGLPKEKLLGKLLPPHKPVTH
jgi:hypothetical protein